MEAQEPTWESVLEKMDEYEHFGCEGALEVFASKRPFQLRGTPEGGLKEALALQFDAYYREMESVASTQDAASQWYERFVQPHLDSAKQHIEVLKAAVEATSSKRVPDKLTKVHGLLSELKHDLQAVLMPYYQEMMGMYGESYGDLGDKGAQTRLRLRLFDVLDTFTNLTKENMIRHIVYLLDHFGIIAEEAYEDPEEAVRQTIAGRRSDREKDKMKRSQMIEAMNAWSDL